MRCRAIFLTLLLFGSIGIAAETKRSCSEDVMCVVVREGRDRAELFVENKSRSEITVTFQVQTTNAHTSAALPHTAVFPPGQPRYALTIQRTRPSESWRYRYRYNWAWGSAHAKHDHSVVYALPYRVGSRYRISQAYNGSFTHNGDARYAVDFGMQQGTEILAARGGLVVDTIDHNTVGGNDPALRSKSNRVKIRHEDGTIGQYDHLRFRGVVVRPGQTVRRGQLLGYSGETGYTRGPHLHFEVHRRLDAHRRTTIPVRFRTAEGAAVTLQQGRSYTAVR